MALLSPSSTFLSAISSSPLPLCSPASHQFTGPQYIYPSSSSTHRQIIEFTSVVTYTLSLVVAVVVNCHLPLHYSWATTHLPDCLPACLLARIPTHHHLFPPAGLRPSPSLISAPHSFVCFIPASSTSFPHFSSKYNLLQSYPCCSVSAFGSTSLLTTVLLLYLLCVIRITN